MDGACSKYGGEGRCIQRLGVELREIHHLEDPGVHGRIIIRWIVRKWGVEGSTGSMWLRIGTGGGHLCM
jgi:hypothetical protein